MNISEFCRARVKLNAALVYSRSFGSFCLHCALIYLVNSLLKCLRHRRFDLMNCGICLGYVGYVPGAILPGKLPEDNTWKT